MTVSELNDRITRALALALGVAIVAVLVFVARPAGGHGGVLPASLRFTAAQDGAIAITPAAPEALLEDSHLRPGRHVAGAITLSNQTGKTLELGLRAEPSSTALDGITRVRISAGAETIFDSTLGALREGTDVPLALGPGRSRRVLVTAWIPAGEPTGYEGRRVDVQLALEEGAGR
jgi:hypothetical protein